MDLAEAPRVRVVDPMSYDPLAQFVCGTEHVWEHECNGLARKLHRGGGRDGIIVRVAETVDAEELVGVTSFLHLPPVVRFPGLPVADDAACIPLLAIARSFRGTWVPDDGPVGRWLLDKTLWAIRDAWDSGMPPVWALVHKQNERCRRMLGDSSFDPVEPREGDYDMWFRPRDIPI
jgi:hypothetical protein